MEVLQKRIWTIPDLLWNQADTLRELLERAKKGIGVSSGGDFVVTALAGQQRPWTPLSPDGVRSAVFSLAKTVMVVATPAGSIRRVHFEHSIDHAQRILNDRIARTTDPDTNQFDKTGI